MELWILYCLVTLSTINTESMALFGSLPVYFRIHGNNMTWNEARTICDITGSYLLDVHSDREWSLWKYILHSRHFSSSLISPTSYWFGLHSPVKDRPDWLALDDKDNGGNCKPTNYTHPLNVTKLDGSTDYDIPESCASMWVVPQDQDVQGWWQKDVCNVLKPFICGSASINGSRCMPVCDELLVVIEADLCPLLCPSGDCRATYIHQTGLCHITPMSTSEYVNPSYATLCYFPSLDISPIVCQDPHEPFDVNVIQDDNAFITDTHCSTLFPDTTTETHIVTEVDTYNETEPECLCFCQQLWTFLATPPPAVVNLTTEEKVEIIVKNLTIDKKNTTVNIRQYVSVMDHRVSSYGIGIVAGVIIFSIIGVIVLMDLVKFRDPIGRFLKTYFSWLRGFRIRPILTLAGATQSIAVPIATGPKGIKSKRDSGLKDMIVNTSSGNYNFDRWFQRELMMLTHTPLPIGETPKAVGWMKREGQLSLGTEKTEPPNCKQNVVNGMPKSVGWMKREGQLSLDIVNVASLSVQRTADRKTHPSVGSMKRKSLSQSCW